MRWIAVEIHAGPDDPLEILERQVGRKSAGHIRRQIARDKGSERHPTGQIVGGVDDLWFTQVRIAAGGKRRVRVAVVAGALGIDDVAPQTDEIAILLFEVQGDGCDLESLADARVVRALVIVVFVLATALACARDGARERDTKY